MMQRPTLRILAVLLLIASGNVYSGGKEYTFKFCDKGKDNCDDCKDRGSKISFKVSKPLGSVMKTILKKDGTSKSSTIDNCKIFDDETFECERVRVRNIGDNYFIGQSTDVLRLSNGKWENIYNDEGSYYPKTTIGNELRLEPVSYYRCGTEIKSIFNPFK